MPGNKDNYRRLVEKLPDAFAYHRAVLDNKGYPVDYIFINVNTSFEEITGLNKEDILGKKITEVLAGVEFFNFDWIETYGRVALAGKSINFETFFVPLARWYQVTAFSDEEEHFITVFKDINELKKEHERTKKIIDYIYKSQELTINNLNFRFFTDTVMELSGAEFVVLNMISDEDKSKTITRAVSVDPDKVSMSTEQQDFNLEGSVWETGHGKLGAGSRNKLVYFPSLAGINYYDHYSISPVLKMVEKVLSSGGLYVMEINHQGEPLGVVALVMPENRGLEDRELIELYIDYSAATVRRLRAEEKLRQSEERYRALVENINEAIIVVQDGVIKYANARAFEIAGYPEKEILYSFFEDYIHSQDREMVMERHRKRLEGEALENCYQFRIINKGGDVRWVEISTVVFEWDGQPATLNLLLDVTERKKAEEKIRYLSFYDNLTGVHNRAYLEEEMHHLDNKQQLPISVIIVDLNGLKLANDTYGHAIGDEMLRRAADILRSSCREEGIIARWGGDEFLIFLPQTKEKEAEEMSRKINEMCRETYIKDIYISITSGVATKESTENDMAEILKEAEGDMYKKKLVESQSEKNKLLSAFLKTLSEKSFETETHVRNMQEVALKIGEKLQLTEAELNRLELLIMLHDIGKINIPEEVLTKNKSLTPEEWELIKKHPETGSRIARATEDFSHVAEEILSHHERWDGTGYPRGLKGEEIPLLARITAVADAYEVMSNGRPYKKPMTMDEIKTEFKRCKGVQFDPRLVEVFLQMESIQDEYYD